MINDDEGEIIEVNEWRMDGLIAIEIAFPSIDRYFRTSNINKCSSISAIISFTELLIVSITSKYGHTIAKSSTLRSFLSCFECARFSARVRQHVYALQLNIEHRLDLPAQQQKFGI